MRIEAVGKIGMQAVVVWDYYGGRHNAYGSPLLSQYILTNVNKTATPFRCRPT
jgi:hypothetical protein